MFLLVVVLPKEARTSNAQVCFNEVGHLINTKTVAVNGGSTSYTLAKSFHKKHPNSDEALPWLPLAIGLALLTLTLPMAQKAFGICSPANFFPNYQKLYFMKNHNTINTLWPNLFTKNTQTVH
jgi:hypothetical protein